MSNTNAVETSIHAVSAWFIVLPSLDERHVPSRRVRASYTAQERMDQIDWIPV
jgi:hypothetical protein